MNSTLISPVIQSVRRTIRRWCYAKISRQYRQHGHANISLIVGSGDTMIQAGCVEIDTVEMWSRAVGPNGRVIVVEALSELSEKLQRATKQLGINNVTFVNSAVWDAETSVPLKTSSFAHRNRIEQNRVHDPCNPDNVYDETKLVAAATLDDILERIGEDHVDFVYLTVSGAEYRAICGMPRLLAQPGIRIHARCMLFDAETGLPMSHKVAVALEDAGLQVTIACPEPGREGAGNVYTERL
jgi:FkbM family methyltransferase